MANIVLKIHFKTDELFYVLLSKFKLFIYYLLLRNFRHVYRKHRGNFNCFNKQIYKEFSIASNKSKFFSRRCLKKKYRFVYDMIRNYSYYCL